MAHNYLLFAQVSQGLIEHFLCAAIKALGMDMWEPNLVLNELILLSKKNKGLNYWILTMINCNRPPPVKVGACRALSQLLPDTNKEILCPHFLDILSSLTDLLKHVSNYESKLLPYCLLFFFCWSKGCVYSPGFWRDHASSAWNTTGNCESRFEEYKQNISSA